MALVHIEFDKRKFDSQLACKQWIRQSEFSSLDQRKDFRLISGRSTFLSKENIKVWSWTFEAWRYSGLKAIRPDPSIYVLVADSAADYSTMDLPSLSAKFLYREQVAQRKRDQRDYAEEKRRQNIITQRRNSQKKQRKSGPAIVDKDPIEALEEKKKQDKEAMARRRADSQKPNKKRKSKSKGVKVKKEKELLESDSEAEKEIEDQARAAKKVKVDLSKAAILQEVEAPKDVLDA